MVEGLYFLISLLRRMLFMTFLIALMIGGKRIVPWGTQEGLRCTIVQAPFYRPNTLSETGLFPMHWNYYCHSNVKLKQKQETFVILH